MKRLDLLKYIAKKGAIFVRHGGEHDVYRQPRTGKQAAIPRHREIRESVAQNIIKILAKD